MLISIIDAVTAKGDALAHPSRNLRHFHAMTMDAGKPAFLRTSSANDEKAIFTRLTGGVSKLGITVVSIFSQRSGKVRND